MFYAKSIDNGYVVGICRSETAFANGITENEARQIEQMFLSSPPAPDGYTYKLRADNLEWELFKLPPVEPEPLTDEEALTRYANSLTGANDPDLISAAETLITKLSKEES